MSAFDKEGANSQAHGLKKKVASNSRKKKNTRETSVLVFHSFNWKPHMPLKQHHLKLIRLKKYIWFQNAYHF